MKATRRTPFTVLLVLVTAFVLTVPAQAVTLLPPRFVPGDDTIGSAAGTRHVPAIARGGNQFLVVWADQRAPFSSTGSSAYEFGTSSDIYGVRLDADGNPLEAVPFVVNAGPAAQENPQVVWNGTNWLVVYESYSIHGTGSYYQKSLEAVRVSPAGTVLDPAPIHIYNVVPTAGMWSVASDGNNWAIAFEGTPASYDLIVLRVGPDGTVLDPPTHSLVPATYYLRFNVRLAYAAGVYLLTWADFSDTLGIRFDQNLNALDAAPLQLLTGNSFNAFASSGDGFYAVWVTQEPPSYIVTVTGSRISTAGVMLDGAGMNISQANSPAPYTALGVVWGGTHWKVTWSYGGVSVARVDAGGQVLDPGGVAVPGLTSGPAAASPAGGLQVVWELSESNAYDIRAAAISPGNTAGPLKTLSTAAPAQVIPDVAVGDAGYMLVYRSDIAGFNRVMAQPLDLSGDPLTAAPVQLDSGDSLNGPDYPAVAWNGSQYLVAWSNGNSVLAQRIGQDGTLLDPGPFTVISGFGPVDVAALGDNYLVIGRKMGITPQYIFPVAARVRGSDGAVLDPSPLVVGGSYTRFVAVTTLGGRWLAVWQENFSHDDPLANTVAAFVNADGTHTVATSVYGIYTTSSYSHGPAVASNGSAALVVQNAEISSGVEMDLGAVIVNADGSLQPAVNLTPWSGNQYRPRVAWDGSRFVVVYSDQRNRLGAWELDQLDARGDLFGMRVSAAGAVLDPRGFLFSNSARAEAFPSVAASNGTSLIAAAVMREAPYAAYRVGYELRGTLTNAWPVAVASAAPAAGDVPLPVTFSSAGSSDPDGSLVSYYWDFGDGAVSTDANPAHTYTTGGPFVATLTVTDDDGAQTTNTVFVDARLPNVLPVAHASSSVSGGVPPFDVTFYAAGSYDPDGSLGNFHWAFSEGGEYWGPVAYNTFTTAGPHTATLTVYDDRGGTASTTVVINGNSVYLPLMRR